VAETIFGVPYADVSAVCTPTHDFWMPMNIDAGTFADDGSFENPAYYTFSVNGGTLVVLRADQVVAIHKGAP
jgi:hypothetical protein